MNRSQKRKLIKKGKTVEKDPVINIKRSELERIKTDAILEASEIAFILMLSIPLSVIHDKYSLIMKKEVDGKNREERFASLCLDLYDSYVKGYVTLSDLKGVLKDEAGIEIRKIWEKKNHLKIK